MALRILILFLSFSTFAQISQKEFDQTIRLNNGQDLVTAEKNISTLLTKFPKENKVLFLAGMLEYIKKNYNKSIILFTDAIKLDQKYVNAFVARSTAFAALGDFDKAIIDQSKAITLEPNNVDFLSNRAFFYAENKQFKESLDDIMTKIKLDPNNINNYEEAIAAGHNMDKTFN